MQTCRTLCVFRLLLALFLSGTALAQPTNECTGNESWLPVGNSLPGTAIASTEMNGDFYVIHRITNPNSPNASYGISRWDGSAWQTETSLELPNPVRQGEYALSLKGYNGNLYLGGNFTSINNDPAMGYIARWNGTAWSSASANLTVRHVQSVEVHNGDLYVSAYVQGNADAAWRIIRWNGTEWDITGENSPALLGASTISSLLSWNGDLYAGGSTVVKWDGTTWTKVGTTLESFLFGPVHSFAIYNNQLYISGNFRRNKILTGIARWNGTEWENNLPMPENPIGATKLAAHGNQLYMISSQDSMVQEPALGYNAIDRFDGTGWHIVSNTNGGISFITEHDGTLYIGGNFTASCGSPVGNIARMCDASTCGRISGTVFHDIDSDCTQDQNERGLQRRIVEISPGGYLAVTDEDGNYSSYVDPGTYTVGLRQYGYWNQACPAPPGTHSAVVSTTSNVSGLNFGAQPIPNIQDLRVSVVAGRARQGRQLIYAITYENYGTVTMNGTVHFMHDPILTFDSAQGAATRYSPSMAEWDFTGLQPDEIRTIHVWTTVPVATPMETNICSQLWITPENIEVASDNDRDSICVPVTGGYDPNDIQVTPLGREGNGVISSRDSVLTYWVRFQNTGNDTAFKVVVVDTLSSHLDIASIRLGAASHPFSFSIDKANVLVWTFNDIMLPDSNANEANSHGFFKFSVKLKRDLPPLTEIANQAHIYFDYNAPVATNTVISILGASMGVDRPAVANTLAIYPNPARDRAAIGAQLRTGAAVTLHTLLGETVRSYRYDGSGEMTLDLRDLPAGVYLLTAETADGIRNERITVVK